MADKLAVWNQALIYLGSAKITTLTTDAEARYVFDDAWPGVVEEAFNEGDWNFAKQTAELAVSTTGTAAAGWSTVYDYPSDYLRSVAVSPNSLFDIPFREFVDQGGFLHANVSPIYLIYIRDDLVDDADIPNWPTMFWRFTAMKLAYETCERLTQGSTKEDKLEKRLMRALRKAKSVDARNEHGRELRNSSWLRARGTGAGTGSDRVQIAAGGSIVLQDGDV